MPTDGACGGTHGLHQRGGSRNGSIWDIDLIDVHVKIDQMSPSKFVQEAFEIRILPIG